MPRVPERKYKDPADGLVSVDGVSSGKSFDAEEFWLSAAAGNEALAEELRTGTCRCGKRLGDMGKDGRGDGCRWHAGLIGSVGAGLRALDELRLAWTGADGPQGRGLGKTGEDLELLGRFLPQGFLLNYELLLHKGLVLNQGGVRGGRGYDESVEPSAGRPTGGMGSVRSGQTERRIGAGGGSGGRGAGSEKPVIRSHEAVLMRDRIDRKLRALGRQMAAWMSEGEDRKRNGKGVGQYRCTGKKCRRIAEADWHYCPNCGSRVEQEEKK